MRLALDAMGGDTGPAAVVAGALHFAAAHPDVSLVLVGDEVQVRGALPALPDALPFAGLVMPIIASSRRDSAPAWSFHRLTRKA